MSGEFTTVRTEGGLLPPELLQQLVDERSSLEGLKPEAYGLAANERLGEAAARAWRRVQSYWAAFRTATEELPPGESGVSETREQWLLPLLRELGYRDVRYQAAAETIGDRRYPISHRSGPVPLLLVSYRQGLNDPMLAGERRRVSPHALLQEYLNLSDATWGIVSNGHTLRLLRDSASLTRQAYVEWDLRGTLEDGVYSDFLLLYLSLHRSRLPGAPTPTLPEGEFPCWLDRWRGQAEALGARALGELRTGVEQALVALGTGFLAHPANDDLRRRLGGGELTVEAYYQQLLRLIYRLIFLFVAEDRNLIFPPDASPEDRRRYYEHYAAGRLRDLARKYRTDDRHDDLWRGLRVTFDLVAGRRRGLGVPVIGGGLFDEESCPDVDGALLRNQPLAEAITRLSWVRVGQRGRTMTRRVNYRDMDVEELGGVYEALLERQPQLLATTSHIRFEFIKSSTRKQTGSYYTPSSLVQELIRSALEPVIADRLSGKATQAERREALLSITVCDPASGSGHFLLAAARRLAHELARIDAGDAEPSPAQRREAQREVIRRCIYGVDVNPLAVDLCKLALWIEGHDPGKPLNFLDHHVKLGNSLIGATWELIKDGIPNEAFDPVTGDDKAIAAQAKKRNRQSPPGQLSMAAALDRRETAQRALAAEARRIAALPEDGALQLRELGSAYETFERERLDAARLPLDAWTAAFFWPLTDSAPEPPTSASLSIASPEQPPDLTTTQRDEIERLRREYRFFHWAIEFAEVFDRGGFDCVLGNPPWERIKLEEQEFFAGMDDVAKAANKAARQKKIAELATANSSVYNTYLAALRSAEATSKFVRVSKRFELTAVGDVNLYALFAEHDSALLNGNGRAGIVVPTGIATDDSTKRFFQDIAERGRLATLFDFENRTNYFPGVAHGRLKFSLLTLSSGRIPGGDLAFFLTDTSQLADSRRRFQLAAEDFALLNPNTRTCPIFRTRVDAELTKAIYRRVPVLVNERTGENPWGIEFLRMLDMSNDSHLFYTEPGSGRVPLYEAKLFHQYNHRWATYDTPARRNSASGSRKGAEVEARDANVAELSGPSWRVRPRYWVDEHEVEERLAGRWDRGWLLAFRDIARATDERTAIFCVVPRVGVGNSAPIMLASKGKSALAGALVGSLTSLVFDYSARPKVGGTHLNFFVVNQLAILPPSAYTSADLDFIVPRALELIYAADDLGPFARDLGCYGPPFEWDDERRAVFRAELDAYYAALYGLTRDELRYVLEPQDVYGPDFPGETFRVLKNNEMKQFGEYRTRRMVLEAWDRLGLEPRNRDGRYSVEPAKADAVPVLAAIGASHCWDQAHTDEEPALAAAEARAPYSISPTSVDVATPTSEVPVASASVSVAEPEVDPTVETGTGVVQESLPGLEPPESDLRWAVLQRSIEILAITGPLTARDLAKRLTAVGLPANRHLVNSVLFHEGRGKVEVDGKTHAFRVKPK